MEYNVITDLPEDDYHELPQIGSTTIKNVAVSPAYYMGKELSEPSKSTKEAYLIGSLFHQIILEPETWDYIAPPETMVMKVDENGKKDLTNGIEKTVKLNRATDEGKAVWAEHLKKAKDKKVLEPTTYRLVTSMAEAFKKTNAYKLMFQGELSTEVSIIGPEKKCRFDLLKKKQNHYVAYDLKTTDEIPQDEKAWARYFLKWGYHIQDAWYRSVAEEAGLYIKHFFFAVVSKKPPYDHAIVHLNQDFLDYGKIDAESAYQRYLSCKRDNYWPGKYEMSGEKSLTIELPGWVK